MPLKTIKPLFSRLTYGEKPAGNPGGTRAPFRPAKPKTTRYFPGYPHRKDSPSFPAFFGLRIGACALLFSAVRRPGGGLNSVPRGKKKIFRLVGKKRPTLKSKTAKQNHWLSATRAFISVRRVFLSGFSVQPDFDNIFHLFSVCAYNRNVLIK